MQQPVRGWAKPTAAQILSMKRADASQIVKRARRAAVDATAQAIKELASANE